MRAQEVLAEAARRQITLSAAGDRLRYRGPKAALTPDFLGALRQRKAEILAALQPAPPPPPRPTATPASQHKHDAPCRVCGRLAWWRSHYDEVVCGRCHPPPTAQSVKQWLGMGAGMGERDS
jgi:hypothetical protein